MKAQALWVRFPAWNASVRSRHLSICLCRSAPLRCLRRKTASAVCVTTLCRLLDIPVVQLRQNARIMSGRCGFDSHRGANLDGPLSLGYRKRETASGCKSRAIGQPMNFHLASCPSLFWAGPLCFDCRTGSSIAREHPVPTGRHGFDSRPEKSRPSLAWPFLHTISDGSQDWVIAS